MKKSKEQARQDRGRIFVRIIAALLALMMVLAVGATAIYAIIG